MKKTFLILILALIFIGIIVTWQLNKEIPKVITNFEECVIEGNAVMESYPRQCISKEGTNFTEDISNKQPVACTADAKICPDGSGVGRTGPNCEFAPCPTGDGSISNDNSS